MSDVRNPGKFHLLCLGYGYSAQILARRLLQAGWQVTGTTRSARKVQTMEQQSVRAVVWAGDSELPAAALSGVTHVLHSISPKENGDVVFRFCAAALAELASLRWLGYLSTVGVYGNHDGGWVDESTPVAPASRRSERRVLAERAWLLWGQEYHPAVHIFRLPSIYGPGRNVLHKLKKGTARCIEVPNQYFSRIHVEDLASTLQASIEQPNGGEIYNVCDDLPAAAAAVTRYGAALLGVSPPPAKTLEEADLSPMARSFYQNSRRVRNHKIKQELGVQLAYPDYKVGLRHLFESGGY